MLQFEKLVCEKFTNELLKFDDNKKNWDIDISYNFESLRLENLMVKIYYLRRGILKFYWKEKSEFAFFNFDIPAIQHRETLKKVLQVSLNIVEEKDNLTLAFDNIIAEARKAYKKYKRNVKKKEIIIKNKLNELDAKIMEEYEYSHIFSYYDQNTGIKIASTDYGFYDTNFLTFQPKRGELGMVMHIKETNVKEFDEIVCRYYKLVYQILDNPDRIKKIVLPYFEFINKTIEEEENVEFPKENS